MHDNAPGKGFQRLLMAAYFCAGVGYVVSATFIVAIVDSFEELSGMGYWTFMLLGLAAAPACIFWDLVARRVGDYNALLMAYIVQIASILLPVFMPSAAVTLLGAFLFGATFIGIVSLVLSIAGRYYPTRPAKMMGKMTIAYGIAQIIGPAITGMLAEQSGSYADGLYMAATMMIIGTLIMLRLRVLDLRIRAGNSVA
jgi:MFS family permease